jgi:uncharacterized Zn-binding protein involved in type VI secretion
MPPAARVTDLHTCPMVEGIVPHVGGPAMPPGEPKVIIGFLPAVRVSDRAVCVGPMDTIASGAPNVLIGNKPAARMGDLTSHGGVITLGCPTVLIGTSVQSEALLGAAASGTPFCEECAERALQEPAPEDQPQHLAAVNRELDRARPTTTGGFLALFDRFDFSGAARPEDVSAFVSHAAAVAAAEGSPAKVAALMNLARTDLTAPTPFAHLDPKRVVVEAAVRVLAPYRVNQGGSGLCGAAAFTSVVAATKPEAYAQLTRDLLAQGRGRVGDLEIAPKRAILQHDPENFRMGHADWLVVASLRDASDPLDRDLGHYGGTRYYEPYRWAKKAGFPTAVCLPSGRPMPEGGSFLNNLDAAMMMGYHPAAPACLEHYSSEMIADPRHNMRLAQQLSNNGWHVMLMTTEVQSQTLGEQPAVEQTVNATLEAYRLVGQDPPQAAIDDARRKAERAFVADEGKGANHWVVARRLDLTPDPAGEVNVRIKRWSWGNEATTAPLPQPLFTRAYGGFVAVHEEPLAEANRAFRWDVPPPPER